jgi:hypothetical protein
MQASAINFKYNLKINLFSKTGRFKPRWEMTRVEKPTNSY